MDNTEIKKHVPIYFQKSKDFKIYPVQGVWGGVCSNGDISANMLIERLETPTEIELEVEGNQFKEIMENRKGERVVKEVLCELIMRPEIANAIGNWLIDNAKKAGFNS